MKLTKEHLKTIIKEELQTQMEVAGMDNTVRSFKQLLNIIKSGGQFDPENDVGNLVIPAKYLYQLKDFLKVQ